MDTTLYRIRFISAYPILLYSCSIFPALQSVNTQAGEMSFIKKSDTDGEAHDTIQKFFNHTPFHQRDIVWINLYLNSSKTSYHVSDISRERWACRRLTGVIENEKEKSRWYWKTSTIRQKLHSLGDKIEGKSDSPQFGTRISIQADGMAQWLTNSEFHNLWAVWMILNLISGIAWFSEVAFWYETIASKNLGSDFSF